MADEEELRRDRQEDEFAALQSIYSGDVVDLRKNDAWQVRGRDFNHPDILRWFHISFQKCRQSPQKS